MADEINDQWWRYLQQNAAAWDSFVRYIAREKVLVQEAYKSAATWEDVQILKGEEKRLDNLYRHATMQSKEDRHLKEYREQTKQ